jgi:hypothetical protein
MVSARDSGLIIEALIRRILGEPGVLVTCRGGGGLARSIGGCAGEGYRFLVNIVKFSVEIRRRIEGGSGRRGERD